MAISGLLPLLLIGASLSQGANVVSYTLDIRDWVVDYQRPTVPPRAAPYDILTANKLEAVLANNSFPGPELSMEVGDTLEVTVTNNLIISQVDLVFEGLKLLKGPASPIAPQGFAASYTLQATEPGTYWWHGNPRATAAGLFGAIHVRNSSLADPLLMVLADARATPNVCFNTTGGWDLLGCADIDKATMNGVWGDQSKDYAEAVIQVIQGHCYNLRILGVSEQPHNMFELTIDSHSFEQDGVKGLKSVTVATDAAKATEAIICADQSASAKEFAITYSYYNASDVHRKFPFTATLKYV